jgi:hypothetical protein
MTGSIIVPSFVEGRRLMNEKLQEILDKIDGSAVLYVSIAPNIEIEDKEGIPYEVQDDALVFNNKGSRVTLPVPENTVIGEYAGGSERVGDAEGLNLRTPDFSVSASIEYSYSKSPEYYEKLRQQAPDNRKIN